MFDYLTVLEHGEWFTSVTEPGVGANAQKDKFTRYSGTEQS